MEILGGVLSAWPDAQTSIGIEMNTSNKSTLCTLRVLARSQAARKPSNEGKTSVCTSRSRRRGVC